MDIGSMETWVVQGMEAWGMSFEIWRHGMCCSMGYGNMETSITE